MATARLQVETVGARRLASRMQRAAAELPAIMAEEMRGRLSPALVRAYRVFAPRRSGRLRGNIASRVGGTTLQVESTARSDQGYPYTGVTRYGHRVKRIYPRRAKALRFVIGGRVVFASSVRGYSPTHDWAQDAHPGARREVATAGRVIGHRVAERL
jgi:hypothetical protein